MMDNLSLCYQVNGKCKDSPPESR